MKTLTYERECGNVLLGQGYRTPRVVVVGEYGAIMKL
jgi:hypothetical protein